MRLIIFVHHSALGVRVTTKRREETPKPTSAIKAWLSYTFSAGAAAHKEWKGRGVRCRV